MMGTCYLTLPFIFKRIGWALGLVALLACGIYSLCGYKIVVKAAEAIQIGSMRMIIQTLLGKWVSILIDVAVCLEFVGYLICYVSVTADYFRLAIINFSGLDDEALKPYYFKIGFGILLFLLSLIKSLECFSRISSFSMVFICITVISVVVFCIQGHVNGVFTINLYDDENQTNDVREDYPVPNWGSLAGPESSNWGYAIIEFFMRLPVFQTLFGQYACVTSIYHDMQSPIESRAKVLDFSTTVSTIFAILIYVAMSLSANALFGRNVASNVLLSFPPTLVWMTVCRLLCCFSVCVSYVLILYSVRNVLLSWLPFKEGTKKRTISFYLIGLIVVLITVLLSTFIPNIETVLNFISAIFGCVWYTLLVCMLIYAVPKIKAANYERLINKIKHKDEEKPQEKPDIRKSIDILARKSSFVYDVGNQEEQKAATEMQKQLDRKSVTMEINETRRSIRLSQTLDQLQNSQQLESVKIEQQPQEQIQTKITIAQEQPEQQVEENDETEENKQQLSINELQDELKLLELKDKELGRMNCGRKTCFGISMTILIAINLEAFVFSTFFDMTKEDPFQ